MIFKRAVFAFLVVTFHLLESTSSLIVKTEDGLVEGSSDSTRSERGYYQFLRIPYAETPIGDNRFKAPVAKKPWDGILNCTTYGPMCMQADLWGTNVISEDCLHLNVFTKNDSMNVNDLKPVIAFIHGGGFETGSSIEHGAGYLMDRDVVLVTINYRLGAFGFLAIETAEISGNAGLKDQALALKWINKNIRNFGGDPKKVTIAGLSAGGYSATAHMISPMSLHLFVNVIAMSGALAWQKKLKTNNIDAAVTLATRIDCPTENLSVMVLCLKYVSLKFMFRRNKKEENCLEISTGNRG